MNQLQKHSILFGHISAIFLLFFFFFLLFFLLDYASTIKLLLKEVPLEIFYEVSNRFTSIHIGQGTEKKST